MADLTELRTRAKATWSAGHWDEVSDLIAALGPKLLDEANVQEGMEVLDVGTGSGGTVAIPAAQRGANVTGSDLVPEHFEDARRRAAEAGVDVEWVEADAESLPFDDGSFDRVLSTFGHMFAPDHSAAGAELARVCRPGGLVAFDAWTPEGAIGKMFMTVGKHIPPPPEGFQPPILWGTEGHVRKMLEPHGLELEFKREIAHIEHPGTPDELTTFYEEKFGPVVMAKAALGDDWPALRQDFAALFEDVNAAEDGSVDMPAEYLLAIGRKPG